MHAHTTCVFSSIGEQSPGWLVHDDDSTNIDDTTVPVLTSCSGMLL